MESLEAPHHRSGDTQAKRQKESRNDPVEETFEVRERHDTHLLSLTPGEWGSCYFNNAKIDVI